MIDQGAIKTEHAAGPEAHAARPCAGGRVGDVHREPAAAGGVGGVTTGPAARGSSEAGSGLW